MGILSWHVLPASVAANGLRADFLPAEHDFVHAIEVSQTLGTDEWGIMLLGYEGNFVNVAKDIVGLRNALEAAQWLVDWILILNGGAC
jgi:hypothetical protein